MLTSIRITCPRCGYERTYMGSRLALLGKSKRPIRIKCTKCLSSIRIN